ncbi:hypothetical protein, partial [Vibrio diabolicus]|uniref:hypothetical protein n=1 Tax=Vibrio diabolicus TaxID=50719 RepID=UPI00211B00B7
IGYLKKSYRRALLFFVHYLCVMAACAQYYILSMITGYNLPEIAGLALVATNAFFFVGFHSAYRSRLKILESKK